MAWKLTQTSVVLYSMHRKKFQLTWFVFPISYESVFSLKNEILSIKMTRFFFKQPKSLVTVGQNSFVQLCQFLCVWIRICCWRQKIYHLQCIQEGEKGVSRLKRIFRPYNVLTPKAVLGNIRLWSCTKALWKTMLNTNTYSTQHAIV